MTINFSIQLEIPDELKSFHDDELNELMYDVVVKSAILHHIHLTNLFSSKDDKMYDGIISFHEGWYRNLSEVNTIQTKIIEAT